MKSEKILLENLDILITDKPDVAYKVTSGKVNIYVSTIDNGVTGRRVFLTTAEKDAVIPSLSCEKGLDFDDGVANWCFIIAPVGSAELESIETSEEIKKNFCEDALVDHYEMLGFEEATVEFYRFEITRDMRAIYVSSEQNKEAKSKILSRIYYLFASNIEQRVQSELSKSNLYDSATVVCQWMKIDYVPIETMYAACGRNFNVNDIARLSGFACRKITLSADWPTLDGGAFLAFYGDNKEPVACLPKKRGQYYVFFGDTDEVVPLTKEIAKKISPSAVMFYRPFPHEKMNMKKLAAFAMEDIKSSDIVSIVIFALFGMLISLLIPYMNEQIYDTFIPLGYLSGLKAVGVVIIACTTGSLAFALVQSFCGFRITNRMKHSIQAASIDRLFNLPQSFFGKYDSAEIAKIAMNISEIFSLISDAVIQYGFTLLFSLLYLFKIFAFNEDIAWAAILMLAVVSFVIVKFGDWQIPSEKENNDLNSKNASLLYQFFTGINKLRIAGAEDRAIAQYMKGFTRQTELNIKSEKYNYATSIIVTSASTVFSIVFYFLVVRSGDSVSIGKFMGFSTAFSALSNAALNAASQWLTVNNVIPYYEKAKPLLETLPEKMDEIIIPTDIKGEIDVNNLTFGYEGLDSPILNDISFHIKAGEYVGIVGSSGSGKSTLLKLLLGFEKPQQGKIYYDGQDIDTVDKRELRKKLGVVLQDGGIITGTILENITIAKPNAKLKEVKEALRAVDLEDDINEMPMGLQTLLSEGAGGISGGQKQRILIARAIVGKPKIIFLDEATSALDNNTQTMVVESMDKLKATRVVIAHRLSTVMQCDRILVLDKGKIVEEGNYKELMKKKGLFYQQAIRQIAKES